MTDCQNCASLELQIAQLRTRIAKLAREKSHLQLVADVLSSLAKLKGVVPIAQHTLNLLMNFIGGTNISFYYKMEQHWICLDVYGRDEVLSEPDDPDVIVALEKRQFWGVHSIAAQGAPFTMSTGKSRFEKWIFPLMVEEEVFGALCADGLLIHLQDTVVEQLGIISTYISLVLKNETLAQSKLKRAYDALKKKNQELEAEIDTRIHVEQEKHRLQIQLQQAQKMEAIGTLAGGIAHDFNNLLGAIIGYADLAEDQCTDIEGRHYLEQVLHAADRAKELVNQILAFSRKQDAQNEPIYVGPVVKEVMKLLRATIPTTIEMISDIDNDCPAILGNATQLHQIVMNLCTNAAHAMEQRNGKLHMALSTGTNSKNAAVVRLRVSDTGIGMSADVLSRIFEPYFTTRAPGKGTGMGLAVVHGIVHSLGGEIFVQSTPGDGTVITCEFPAVTDDVRESDVPDPLQTHYYGIAMVVDDEAAIASLAAQMLRKIGFEADVFTQSQDAYRAFLNSPERYTLLFTDQTMPEMTGLQLAHKVNELRRIPVILSSGYNAAIDSEISKAGHIAFFLPKPFKFRNLQDAVATALGEPAS